MASEFIEYLTDLFSRFGPVEIRKMFGGYGIYHEGVMFGIVSENQVFLKADELTVSEFVRLNLPAFSYPRKGKMVSLGYYRVPEDAMDDAGEMRRWADDAWAVALRSRTPASKKR